MEGMTKDYINDFDWKVYLDTYFKDPKFEPFVLQNLHKFWNQIKGSNLKVLEYGVGPNISRVISACPHIKDLVLAEYAEGNRNAVKAWIDKDPKAFDWKNTFSFIVQELEGKGSDEVAKREEELRQKIRAVVPCDLTAENILEIPSNLVDKYGPPYDVVFSGLCLEAVVESEQEYKDAVTKLAKLVKPGGYLVMHMVIRQTFYMVGSKKFYSIYLTKEMVEESMKNAGVKEIEIDMASSYSEINFMPFCDNKDEMFTYGRV